MLCNTPSYNYKISESSLSQGYFDINSFLNPITTREAPTQFSLKRYHLSSVITKKKVRAKRKPLCENRSQLSIGFLKLPSVKQILENTSLPPSQLIDTHTLSPSPSLPKIRFSYDFPCEWEPQESTCQLFPVLEDTDEYQNILKHFGMFPNSNLEVQRIQNIDLWRRYCIEKQFVAQKNNGVANERELFHGTRQTTPEEIYTSEEGFDMRYCTQGKWGIGSYFAENVEFSFAYSYINQETKMFQVLVAKVVLGSVYESPTEEPMLRKPPRKAPNSVCYDSVRGVSLNTNIFTVYNNAKAYPSYLVSIPFSEGTTYTGHQ